MSITDDPDDSLTEDASRNGKDQSRAGARDVEYLYHLFLGRPPEDQSVVANNRHRSFDELLKEIVGSQEFAARVERDIGAGQAQRLDWQRSKGMMRWMSERFSRPISQLKALKTHQSLLATALTSATAWEPFRHTFGRRALDVTIRLHHLSHIASEWEGYLDECNETWIRGWVQRRPTSEPVRLAIYADGALIALAEANEYRKDVAEATNTKGICGFVIKPQIAHAMRGRHSLKITLKDAETNEIIPLSGEIAIGQTPNVWELAAIGHEVRHLAHVVDALSAKLRNLTSLAPVPSRDYGTFHATYEIPKAPDLLPSDPQPPLVSIILPLAGSSSQNARAAIDSVLAQSVANWELVLVCGASGSTALQEIVAQAAAADRRIVLVAGDRNLDPAESLNLGLERASGSYILPLDPDDEIDRRAIEWFSHVAAISEGRLIYADEACFNKAAGYTSFHDSHFKPAFDYDLLLQRNFIGKACCLSRSDLLAVQGFWPECNGAHLYDTILRLVERLHQNEIVHIPLALYHQRGTTLVNAQSATDTYPVIVEGHLIRSEARAKLVANDGTLVSGEGSPQNHVEWAAPTGPSKISIIIPTRDRHDLLRPCVDSLARFAASPSQLELLIVDNQSSDPATIDYLQQLRASGTARVLEFAEPFNWSRINNVAARAATGDILLFMNNDMEMCTHGYDDVLRGLLARNDVGAVGALLLYGNGSIQHAGTAVGVDGVAAHISVAQSVADGGYQSQDLHEHNVSAVTGAFIGVARRNFAAAGGFDEEHLKIAFNDVDFCLKIRELGLGVLYTPRIACLHYESISRGSDTIDPVKAMRAQREAEALQNRWGEKLLLDPFYNPMFSRRGAPFRTLQMPSRETVLSHVREQMRWQKLRARRLASSEVKPAQSPAE